MAEQFLTQLEILKPFYSHLIISATVWLTYHYTLRNSSFVSDDIMGLAEYDGKLQGYEYGMLWRWLRYWIVGGNHPSGHKNPDGSEVVQGKYPPRHHFVAVLLFNLTAILAYQALCPVVGQAISLMAVLILVVHPCSTQGVAWVSGIAYPLSLIWISTQVLLMQYYYSHQSLTLSIIVIPLFCIIQWLAIHAIFATTFFTCVLLAYLGYWHFAILGALISGAMCFDQIFKTVKLRRDEFRKQHMEASTIFGIGKIAVAMKTLYYYLKHAVFPIRMGLYHEWGFHYEKSLERRDGMFWLGVLCLTVMGFTAFFTPYKAVQLGIIWFIIFSIGFWNWITAQQFVTERYIMVAILGLGLVIAQLTVNHLWLYTLILGCYLCRTWCHLPTYDNELRFYQSNVWNFQKSEVAYGNLGVTYARLGMSDTARDTWMISAQINPDYDVPHVNVFYQLRTAATVLITNGDYDAGLKKLREAIPYLEKALRAKVCHFPEQWQVERAEAIAAVQNPSIVFEQELGRLLTLSGSLNSMLSTAPTPERRSEVSQSIANNDAQMARLVAMFRANGMTVNNPSIFNRYNSERILSTLK